VRVLWLFKGGAGPTGFRVTILGGRLMLGMLLAGVAAEEYVGLAPAVVLPEGAPCVLLRDTLACPVLLTWAGGVLRLRSCCCCATRGSCCRLGEKAWGAWLG
jgi:hypothetical protein